MIEHALAKASRYRSTIAAAAIVVAIAVAYLPAFSAGFVYDDHAFVEGSEDVHGPLWKLWADPQSPDYWPLTWTTFWMESRLFGDDAPTLHTTNIVLHAIAALLLWRVLAALRIPGAALAGVLFAVHPAGVESVAWISERKNTLSAVLFLATALAWVRFEDRRRSRFAIASVALFTLACLAKTSVVMLPFVLLAISYHRRRKLKEMPWGWLAAMFGVAFALGVVTMIFQWSRALPDDLPPVTTPASRVASAAWSLGFYLLTAFVPAKLAFVYPDWPFPAQSALFYGPLAILGGCAALVCFLRRRIGTPLLTSVGYHVLMVLPVIGLVDLAYSRVGPVSNHLQYLALFGPVAFFASAIASIAARGRRKLAIGLAVTLVTAYGASTYRRAEAFEDDLTLWRTAAEDAPQSLFATLRYSDTIGETGRLPEAVGVISDFAKRVRDPAAWHRARAIQMFHLGFFPQCVAELQAARALRSAPSFDARMGELLVKGGRYQEAIGLLPPILDAEPRSATTRYWLAAALMQTGHFDESIATLREGLRLRPGNRRLEWALSQVLEAKEKLGAPTLTGSEPAR